MKSESRTRTYNFSLPGVTCVNCIIPIEHVLKKFVKFNITPYAIDLVSKNLSISVDEDRLTDDEVRDNIINTLDDIGVECVAKMPPVNPEDDSEALPAVTNNFYSHLIKGLFGTIIGTSLIAVTLSGFALPLLATQIIVITSSLLTLGLGAEYYYDAAKKFLKAGTLTMDALFTISTLTVIGVSIASLFVPWLPMMLETGLLIFGFRHLGKALEESLIQSVSADLSFKDRGVQTVSRKQSDEDIIGWSEVLSSQLLPGQLIRVKRGEIIPVDGISESDSTSLYDTIITGAIIPTRIQKGEAIFAGMEVPENVEYIEMRVTKPITESYLAYLDQKILQASQEKAPIEVSTNKILQYFIPGVLLLAAAAGVAVGILFTPALAIQCVTSILVSACPCILGFITPLAMKVGISKAVENGVLFKNSKALQSADDIDTVVFDLNGTLTKGVPQVSDYQIHPESKTSPAEFFSCLASIESQSKHPVAKAIYSYSAGRFTSQNFVIPDEIDDSNHAGIRAVIGENSYWVGNIEFLRENAIELSPISNEIYHAEQKIYFVKNKQLLGHLNIKDPLRDDAKSTVAELKAMGKDVYICTGAEQSLAEYFAKELEIPIENVQANCMNISNNENRPTKADFIHHLKSQQKRVAMIGDAANDALAIVESDFGLAVKSISGDIITQEQASAVIKNASLLPVVTAFAAASQTVNAIKQNLLISLAYNSTVLLASGAVLVSAGVCFNPALGVLLMVLQSALVLVNQYRIKHSQFEHLQNDCSEKILDEEKQRSTYGQFKRNGLYTNERSLSLSSSSQFIGYESKSEDRSDEQFLSIPFKALEFVDHADDSRNLFQFS